MAQYIRQKPSERYGALHLLRMLAKLPAMFPPESFAEDADALLVQTKTNELSKFLASRAREFGVREVAIDVSPLRARPITASDDGRAAFVVI